jgi:hypothetical protein
MANNFEKVKVKATGGKVPMYEMKATRTMVWSYVVVLLAIVVAVAYVVYEFNGWNF